MHFFFNKAHSHPVLNDPTVKSYKINFKRLKWTRCGVVVHKAICFSHIFCMVPIQSSLVTQLSRIATKKLVAYVKALYYSEGCCQFLSLHIWNVLGHYKSYHRSVWDDVKVCLRMQTGVLNMLKVLGKIKNTIEKKVEHLDGKKSNNFHTQWD